MQEFEVGEYVQILCHDGAEFEGFLDNFTEDYFTLRRPEATLGFPIEDVVTMTAGPSERRPGSVTEL